MGEDKGNFIDFILDAQSNKKLAMEFLRQKSANQLSTFFIKHKYRQIDHEDSEKLIEAKENFSKGIMQGFGVDEDYY